jgi:hypothetical protein
MIGRLAADGETDEADGLRVVRFFVRVGVLLVDLSLHLGD